MCGPIPPALPSLQKQRTGSSQVQTQHRGKVQCTQHPQLLLVSQEGQLQHTLLLSRAAPTSAPSQGAKQLNSTWRLDTAQQKDSCP
eukprot:1156896-Pelagomonas_calceolata.AAC.18